MTSRIGEISRMDLFLALKSAGVIFDLGAACVRVRSDVKGLADAIGTVYGDYPPTESNRFCDATVDVRAVSGLRKFYRPQIELVVDTQSPFIPFPADTHLPLMEWGLNHALAERLSHYLLLHSGTLARGDAGVLLPATPGSGKSTLTAALMARGYRLLSDEFGVVDLQSGNLHPMVRPIALKNSSIDVIRSFAPDSVLGPEFPRTRKGTVAHLAPSAASVAARSIPALPRVVAFPKYSEGAECRLDPVDPGAAFNKLAINSFNYEFLGAAAFDAVARLVKGCSFWRLSYSRLEDAVAAIDRLLEEESLRLSA